MPWTPSPKLLAPLVRWFDKNKRTLPWRVQDLHRPHPNPYVVLVSELMLQQTQVTTVIPYFERWMKHFSTIESLATADEMEIHKLWEGLGYYRRARHLQASAKIITEKGWPRDLKGLLKLPGLGPYTAAAVGAIAFQRSTPALDGNVFRVTARLLAIEEDPRHQADFLRDWLRPALEKHGPSRTTQALMELGATLCLPAPRCTECPLNASCEARRLDLTNQIPPVIRRAEIKELHLWLLAVEAENHWLLMPPLEKGLLAGLWRWPTVEIKNEISMDRAAEEAAIYESDRSQTQAWPGWTQVYTHRKEHVNPLHVRLNERIAVQGKYRWIPSADLSSLPMGKRDQRLRHLLQNPPLIPLKAPHWKKLFRDLQSDEVLWK